MSKVEKQDPNPETKIVEFIPSATGVVMTVPESVTKKRQTVISKGISRTIQTAQYFSLTIQHTAIDCIEWENLDEREKKQDNLTKLAVKNFIQTHDCVLDQLRLGQMHAFKTDHIAKKQLDKKPENLDLDFVQLDDA